MLFSSFIGAVLSAFRLVEVRASVRENAIGKIAPIGGTLLPVNMTIGAPKIYKKLDLKVSGSTYRLQRRDVPGGKGVEFVNQ